MRLKELREKAGLGQKQLAHALKVAQPTISDWENGRKIPSAKNTEKIADYFKVSMDYLLERFDTSVDNGNLMDSINPLTGKKMTSRERKQLNEVLENAQALFFDDEISERDKETFLRSINDMFWEAKEMNRRKKK